MTRVRAAALTITAALTLAAQPTLTPTATAALLPPPAVPGPTPAAAAPSVPAPTPATGRRAALTAQTSHAKAGTDPHPPAGIAEVIDEVLADPALAGSQAGVVVADARTGATLVDRAGARRLLPASNVKLFTSAAALAILGPGRRFVTEVKASGVRRGSSLTGDLHLRGEGDPALSPADLDGLARDVAATGLQVITGNLVADDTSFDSQRLGPDWAWDDETSPGAAPVSALTLAPDEEYLAGTVTVKAVAAPVDNRPARLTVDPPSRQLTVINRTTTVGSAPGIEVTRRHGTDEITVTGRVLRGAAPVTRAVTVREPTVLVADVFRTALRRHGVRVKGLIVAGKATPAEASVLARHRGRPLRELMRPLLKRSNNAMAEQLVKAVGRTAAGAGTWPAGTNAIASYLARLGVDTSTMRLADGSGLSRHNLVPPAAIARFLLAVRSEPWFRLWYDALPLAGHPDPLVGGTLRLRMRDTPAAGNVRAKTGTLTGASALSGYVTSADNRPLVFSVVINNQLSPSVTPLLDRIAVALARRPQGPESAGGAL
ncbi:D-alanyl-D-alanine carboxypeptidase/D-alanyl-D-alanine endopeptidase [Paractinoplanes brasiliensis]|uniref:D-alanyl-D-alanine carboxypeptidase/D-alanyl-D-alanine-endopeptidase (Penicillin-binding protein 4) n=1 Tax=Paractinoplanes brasiliensis TaxID=52695 RepID=A0A4R6JA19_9ACTN|nr:D-alanyl-D-alanine carboxypeptidase/D-alanyl-D-alanine-endopeptidase [Actinoplanes brasiliensis]TDO32523.1 D-alanyl-D-alanine carboxypeptidase/D-alanyl-D-alanine-endopeptidase (penicillin-binding protein 4) [Actinoplanes brasiliensis]GID27601.1 D-alanyl-D-alanine carboxypeptidase DacC [Actinoplanes brasiliensis]